MNDSQMVDVANGLKAQLVDYNARFALVAKENKKMEKRNAELFAQVKKTTDEYNELQFQIREVRTKTEAVISERQLQEQRNAELESEIAEAKKGLRDLQLVFKNVQEATEALKKKHGNRDGEFTSALSQNKKLKAVVVDLEWKLKDAEASLRSMTASKDEVVNRLNYQLAETHEILINTKEESVRLRQEKIRKERELEEWKAKSKDRMEQLHAQFDRKIEQYMDSAMKSNLEAISGVMSGSNEGAN